MPSGVAAGSYGLTITGTDLTGITHSVNGILTIRTGADFTLSVSPPQNIQQNQSASYQISVAPEPAGSGFNGTVTLSMGAITGGVSGSLSTTVISASSPATLTLNAANNASLGTYPILVNGIATSGTISHSVLAVLGVALGTTPGASVTLGTIRVQQGGPALTVSSPLNNGDTIASCSSPPTGITATLNPGQTVSVQASGSATAGTVTCTTTGTATLQPMYIFLPIEPGPGPPLTVTASLLSGGPNGSGNYQVEVSSDWLDEIDGVTICGSAGSCPDATSLVADGGSTATFDVNVPAVANGQSCSYNVVAEGYSGDPDDNGPVYGYGSVELCPAAVPYTISGTVTASGTGSTVSGVTINLSGGASGSAGTGANGSYTFGVDAGGTYAVAPASVDYTFSPPSFQFSNISEDQTADFTAQLNLACSGLSTGYLGEADLGAIPRPTALSQSLSVTGASTNVTSVDFVVWNETQAIGQGQTLPATAGTQQITIQLAQLPAVAGSPLLGSYEVVGRVHDSSGNILSCPNPAFFDLVNSQNFPPKQPATACSILGTWSDSSWPAPNPATWTLAQVTGQNPASAVAGAVTTTSTLAGTNCGPTTWKVSGAFQPAGSLTPAYWLLNATSPVPGTDTCGNSNPNFGENVSLEGSGQGCDQGTVDLGPSSNPNAQWTLQPPAPASETSNFQSWGGNNGSTGLTTNALYTGQLVAAPNTSPPFSGRAVKEVGTGAVDGCYSGLPTPIASDVAIKAVNNGSLVSAWNVQLDNSYGPDEMGYGAAIARLYQQYVGTCTMTINQMMQISTDSAAYQTYQTNSVVFTVNPGSYSVQRDTKQPASLASKNPWPNQ